VSERVRWYELPEERSGSEAHQRLEDNIKIAMKTAGISMVVTSKEYF